MATREQRAISGIKILGWACLFGSTVTSWYFLYQLLGGAESFIVTILLGAGVLVFQGLIDFVGVGTILPTGAKTLSKAIVGEKTRKTVILAGGIIFTLGAGCAVFSGLTSWYGSQIAGSTLAGAFNVEQAQKGVVAANKARDEALAPHQARIDSLTKAKVEVVKTYLGAKMADGYAQGKPWHLGEVAKNATVKKSLDALDKQIASANDILLSSEKAQAPSFAKLASVSANDLQMKADAHAAKAEGSYYLLRFFGLGCVIMGLVCQLIIVLLEVAAQTKPKKARVQETDELAGALEGTPTGPTKGGAGNGKGGRTPAWEINHPSTGTGDPF